MTDNMIDYLFKDIVKDIEYAHSHRTKVNKLPNEDKLKVKLIKSCSLGKDDYLSIIREYPLNLMNGNVTNTVNRVLLDYYGNK